MARTHWRQGEMWHFFINFPRGRSLSDERKLLSKETFRDVRIPPGYHNREPLDLSPLALWYFLLRHRFSKSPRASIEALQIIDLIGFRERAPD